MSSSLRVNDNLFQDAEIEGSIMNRSTAKQVEFWAELGKRVAQSVAPSDMLALLQGIAHVRVELPDSRPINPETVFARVDKAGAADTLGQQITRAGLYYEASTSQPGLLDRVMPDGSRLTGRFNDGIFVPE